MFAICDYEQDTVQETCQTAWLWCKEKLQHAAFAEDNPCHVVNTCESVSN